MYKEANANPKRRKTNDCVVRAICNVTGKQWSEVYNKLCAIGSEMYLMPNDKRVYTKYLAELGWQKQPMPKKENGIRFTLKEFVEANGKITIVASVVKHLTAIVEGELHDTWNCGHKCIGNFYSHLYY
jgi:hypothetical protein